LIHRLINDYANIKNDLFQVIMASKKLSVTKRHES
jgi:hypothetical protein